MSTSLYPAGPAHVPADLAKPSGRYRLMVAATLLSIVLFVAVYGAMLYGSIWLFLQVVTFRFDSYRFWGLVLHIAAALAALMLPAFLVKFMFKGGGSADDNRLRLEPEAHPELVAFIGQLCAETGAPRPKHIYLTPEVNAAVFYQHPLLSLVWPVRKSLLIGVGLVNALTLSEFKAVLAHEFGHFAQSSMRLGSYVYSTNRLLHDIVFGRDKWDELLAQWRRLDLRVSAVAWVLTGMVWLVRKALELAYRGVNLVHAHLSREMEFQADRVAVRVAGSDAIVDALYQINRANEAYQVSLGQLGTALEHQLVSDDVYYHQTLRLAELSPAPTIFRGAAVEAPAAARLFTAEEVTLKAEMYSSHPADHLRELSAKTPYVPAPADDRSPWLLFSQPVEVRRLVTGQLYPESAAPYAVRPAAEVEAFLAAETAELTYDAAYGETYDGRLISPLTMDDVERLAAQLPLEAPLLTLRTELYGPELHEQTRTHQQRRQDLAKLELFARGEVREASFTVAGQTYPAKQHAEVTAALQRDEATYQRWLTEFDERAAALHWRLLAGQPGRRADWQARYELLLHLRTGFNASNDMLQQLRLLVDSVVAQGQVSESEATRYVGQLEQLRQRLLTLATAARQTTLLPLRHLEEAGIVADYVLRDYTLPQYPALSGEWINELGNLLEGVLDRYRRLYFKNLGVLLRLQEEATADYAAAQTVMAG
jgi:Zn-dependent protease with chaperone function